MASESILVAFHFFSKWHQLDRPAYTLSRVPVD
jgi:hypothetical protein